MRSDNTRQFGSSPSSAGRIGGGRHPDDHEEHLLDRLNVIYRQRYRALGILAFVLLCGQLHTYTSTPKFRAQARLLIETERESAAEVTNINNASNQPAQGGEPFFQTQFRILTGRELAQRVAKRLNLERVPEFNGTAPGSNGLGSVLMTMRRRITTSVQTLLGNAPKPAQPSERAVVSQFLSRISVEPVKGSRLVDVSFVSADPEFAARAVNALAEEYVQQNFEVRRQNMANSLEWLAQELENQQKKVEDGERALAQYREDQDALSLEDRQNIVVSRLNQINDAVTKAKTIRVQKESLYNQIKSLGPSALAETIPAILQNPYIQTMKSRLVDLQRDKSNLSQRYGEKHPEIVTVEANIEDASRQLQLEVGKAVEAIRNDYQSALAEEQTLTGTLEEQKAAAMDLNRKSIGYTVLEREAHSNRQVHETLLQREKELQVMANSHGNNVRLIGRADTPEAPFTPNPQRNLLLAAVGGLALALGMVFCIDYLDDTLKTPEDVARKLRLPYLGMVPKTKRKDYSLLSPTVPQEFGEAFRALRTSLVFSAGGESARVVVLTSSQALEGKTTTACNLAIALAFGGARVLLIDADMRRPGVHRMLGLQNHAGLSQLLTGRATPREVIQKIENPNLWVMSAGQVPQNPSELLASERMKALIGSAQSGSFDWIIIDAPPVLPVTDAVILAPLASGLVFVVGAEMTRGRHARQAIHTLMASKPQLIGAVLNRVDLSRNKYYYSRCYGYKYSHVSSSAA